jgi:hypothetical protein
MLLVDRPSASIVALLRKCNNVVLSHCYATGRRRHAAKETSHTCNIMIIIIINYVLQRKETELFLLFLLLIIVLFFVH